MNDDNTSAIAAAVQAATAAALSAEKAAVQAAIVSVNIDNIKVNIKEIKDTLKDQAQTYVTRVDFIEHVKVDDDHEARIRSLETRMWIWVGASGVIAAGLSFLAQHFIK